MGARGMNAMVIEGEALAGAVERARLGRTFDHAVGKFVGLLRLAPDCAPGELAAADIARLRELAEGVIQSIERRLESEHDRQSTQLNLAEGVYAIRAALEQIEIWRRHNIQ
jgi:hypothetical protein